MEQIIISQSTKRRRAKKIELRNGVPEWVPYGEPKHWMQIVEKEIVGKNKKGKTIYHSNTYHEPLIP